MIGLIGAAPAIAATGSESDAYFRLNLVKGQRIGNIYSRTASDEGQGVDADVQRRSGTTLYQVTDASQDEPMFSMETKYNGRPRGKGDARIIKHGAETCSITSDKCNQYLYSSSAIFDRFLFGVPPDRLNVGSSWEVKLPVAWEVGPAGTQTVTMSQLDQIGHSIFL